MRLITTVGAFSLSMAGSLFASSLQDQNKAIAKRAFEEILSHGRFELAEQLYAKDFINHGIHSTANLEEDQAALKGLAPGISRRCYRAREIHRGRRLGHDLLGCSRHQHRHRQRATRNRKEGGTGWHHHLADCRRQDQGGVVCV